MLLGGGGGGGGGKGLTEIGETPPPLTPRMTSVDYGPFVAQAIKKRFGRSQTLLGAPAAFKEFKTLLGG